MARRRSGGFRECKAGWLIAVAAAFLAASPLASAGPLAPGTSAPPDQFILSGGEILLGSATGTFTTPNGLLSGSYVVHVVADPFNVFGLGDLDFIYQFTNNASSTDSIARITGVSFGGALVDAGFVNTQPRVPFGFVAGSVTPGMVDRNVAGDTIGFSFTSPSFTEINPGQTSVPLIIETNLQTFKNGSANVIDGGTATVVAFGTTQIVPEASSIMLLVIGLGMLALCRNRVPVRP